MVTNLVSACVGLNSVFGLMVATAVQFAFVCLLRGSEYMHNSCTSDKEEEDADMFPILSMNHAFRA
jgi:hypothetical protein